jgi:endonuclease-3
VPATKRTREAERGRIAEIHRRLNSEYPHSTTALEYRTPIQLLISTILSAQCTDVRVNEVTKVLFQRYRTAQDFAEVSIEELEDVIRPTGFFRNKAKNIKGCCKAVIERFGGEVPNTMDELVQLDGVGRKTANCVLGNVFGLNEGVVVDTHVIRLSNRLGLTAWSDPVKIEQDLMRLIPRESWTLIAHQIIDHGRAVCNARKPKCGACVLANLCPSAKA